MHGLHLRLIGSSLVFGLAMWPLGAGAVLPISDAPAIEATGRVDLDGFGPAAPLSLQVDSELTPPFTRSFVSVADAQPGFFSYASSADIGNLALRLTGSLSNNSSGGYGDREVPVMTVTAQVLDVITLSSPVPDPYDVSLQLVVDGTITSTSGTDIAGANALLQIAPVGDSSVTDGSYYGIGPIADTLEVTRTVAGTSVDLALNAFLSFNVLTVDVGSTVTGDLANTALLRLVLPPGVTVSNSASGTFGVPINPVPEPQTYALWLCGLGLVAWTARRRSAAAPQRRPLAAKTEPARGCWHWLVRRLPLGRECQLAARGRKPLAALDQQLSV